MKKIIKRILLPLLIVVFIVSNCSALSNSDKKIVFKDKKLEAALKKNYNWKGSFTQKNAFDLSSKKDYVLHLEKSNISDLTGTEFFINIVTISLSDNKLKNINSLGKMPELQLIVINNNSIKGRQFENILSNTGKIKKLSDIVINGNQIASLNFLGKIGNEKNYQRIELSNNIVESIALLSKFSNIDTLILQNNRIKDVTPLKNLKKLTYYIDLRDNCIIDYKPIKHLFDKMYEDFDLDNGMDRYDYYTNPINFKYNGKEIKFPYLTVYYQYQAYAEAIPLFKALGGSASYDKKTGVLKCKYQGKVLVMKDYSKEYTLDGTKKTLGYEMRRMQYDLAYVPVKDICKALGLEFKVKENRSFYQGYGRKPLYKYAPKIAEISSTLVESK